MTDFTTITACGECCVGCSKKINGECPGCIEADGRVPEWAQSGMCMIHACCKEHNARFCGLCREFPCDKLPQMISWNPEIVKHLSTLRDAYIRDILQDCYVEEDLFPMIFTEYEERDYGVLFYNTENRDSFDSNHAVIYKDRIHGIPKVLKDIAEFYKAKGSRPIIYQSMLDDNWFDVIKDELTAAGYKSWIEDQEYMIQSDRNRIIPNPEIKVRMVSEWNDEIENVFIEAEEPWEIMVAKKTLAYPKAWMFAASLNGKIIGLLYGHISERACRVDYLLVSKKHRKTGAGRALFYSYVEWCRENGIEKIYIWPDGDTPKKIYEEGGFRVFEIRKAGRAVLGEIV